MAYTCIIVTSDEKFIFPKFSKTVFKIGNAKINSKVSHMFLKEYEYIYGSFQQYRKVSRVCVKTMGEPW